VAGKTVETQEGTVTIGAQTPPTEAPPETLIAYSSPYQEKLAREEAERLANVAKEIFRGEDWCELPNFYCPLCNYATLDGDLAVLSHGASRHPGVNLKEHISG